MENELRNLRDMIFSLISSLNEDKNFSKLETSGCLSAILKELDRIISFNIFDNFGDELPSAEFKEIQKRKDYLDKVINDNEDISSLKDIIRFMDRQIIEITLLLRCYENTLNDFEFSPSMKKNEFIALMRNLDKDMKSIYKFKN